MLPQIAARPGDVGDRPDRKRHEIERLAGMDSHHHEAGDRPQVVDECDALVLRALRLCLLSVLAHGDIIPDYRF